MRNVRYLEISYKGFVLILCGILMLSSFIWRCPLFGMSPNQRFHCILKNFARFTEKHQCLILSFDKVAGWRPATLLKKNIIFIEHFRTAASYDGNVKDVISDVDLRLKKKYT